MRSSEGSFSTIQTLTCELSFSKLFVEALNMKTFFTTWMIIVALIFVAGCSSEPSNSQNTSGTSAATDSVKPAAQEEGVTIVAFLRGPAPDEGAAKAFERNGPSGRSQIACESEQESSG